MIRIMPDMQVGPLGYLLSWVVLIMIAVGLLFASGLGGALVWAAFWILVALLLYSILSKGIRRAT